MRFPGLAAVLCIAGTGIALPTCSASSNPKSMSQAVSAIQSIMPTSNTCDGADFPDECRTATQAAPFFSEAFHKYNLQAPAQRAAVLALAGVESVDLKYKHNVFPGRPGQGTSVMLMSNFVSKYAASIPEVASEAAAKSSDPNAVLDLVKPDQFNFGSGPWFMTSQCPDVPSKLAQDPDSGFKAYMDCVGVTITDERQQYWNRAKAAFNL